MLMNVQELRQLKGNDIITKKRFFTYANDGTRHTLKGITADMYGTCLRRANGLKTGFITTEFGKATKLIPYVNKALRT
jgi:hypothetical protein